MLNRRKSMISGIERARDIPVDVEDFARYQLGELIQVAMPYLSEEDREFILTGITKEEWDAAFAEGEEESIYD